MSAAPDPFSGGAPTPPPASARRAAAALSRRRFAALALVGAAAGLTRPTRAADPAHVPVTTAGATTNAGTAPPLFFPPGTEDRVRTAVDTHPHHRAAWAALRARLAAGIPEGPGRIGYTRAAFAREAAFAYRLTRDPAFARLAFATLSRSRATDEDQPDRGYGLSRAMMAMGYALAWSWCAEAWTPAERREMLAVLVAAADAWPGFVHANVSSPHRGSNWVGVTRGGELIQHLALRGTPGYGDRSDRIALCLSDLARHLDTAYGPSGWSQEGVGYLEYTFGFLAPAIFAARDAGWPQLWEKARHLDWPRLALHTRGFGDRQPLLPSGVSGAHSTNEGFVSLVWPFVAPAERPGYAWFYERHAGHRATPPDFDSRRAGTVWALLFHPTDVVPAPPRPGALFDSAKGAYFFRPRWRDRDDALVSLVTRHDHHSHAWAQSETWSLYIRGLDTLFAAGPVKSRAPADYSKLLVDGRTEQLRPGDGSREVSAVADAHGGGLVINDAARSFGLDTARRRFAVAFDRPGSLAAVIGIDDELARATPFTAAFQLRPEAGVAISAQPATADAPAGFLLRRGDAWLRGWVHGPATAQIAAGAALRVELPATTSARLRLTLALGSGPLPDRPPPSPLPA